MKKLRVKATKLFSYRILLTIFYSIIFAMGISFFIAPAEILSSGITGLVQIVNYFLPSVPFAIIYFLINIPGILIGIFFLGKEFTLCSVISILVVTIFTFFIPSYTLTNDVIINCIFGGILMGYALGNLLSFNSSTGGTDFYGLLSYKYWGLNFVNVSTIINVAICIFAAICFGTELAFYTILSIIVRQLTTKVIYSSHDKLTVWIVGENIEETIPDYVNNNLKRTATIFKNVEGAYSKDQKTVIMATIDSCEYDRLKRNIDKMGDGIFVTTSKCHQIHGKYPINIDYR